jgi:putative dehydrogenase
MMVAMIVEPSGATFVDDGIIGGPPRAGYDGPVYCVSGGEASRLDALAPFGL